MLPANYRIRLVEPADHEAIIEICRKVYPTEKPYTLEELEDHRQVFPQGQFVAVDDVRGAVAGVHFTLRLRMLDFHIDDSWDVLTAGGSFLDHDPRGPTLYGADIMVHPDHQHHGLGLCAHGSGPLLGRGRTALADGRREPVAGLRQVSSRDARR